MVNSIASNIYETLRQNGDVKEVLNSIFAKDNGSMVLNLAESFKSRDSGLFSAAEDSSNDVYTCHVESKNFKNFEESYEDFVANLPLPVAEFSKTVRWNTAFQHLSFLAQKEKHFWQFLTFFGNFMQV